MMRKIFQLFCYLFGNTIGRLLYSSRFLVGKCFEGIGGIGWRWLWRCWFMQKILGVNRKAPWPVSFRAFVGNPANIAFHPDDLGNFMSPGTYFQGMGGKIKIGRNTFIGPNVGIINANHNLDEPSIHENGRDVVIGESCWVGMNAVILPGVTLGPHTTVAAGAVVTRSFTDGYLLIGGVPAKVIKKLNPPDRG